MIEWMAAENLAVAIGRFLFRYRNAVFPLTIVLLLLPGPDLFTHVLDAATLGAVIAALGQIVRAATVGLDYIVRGGREGRVYAEGLVTGGLYAHVRNPMYFGNVLIATGVAAASNSLTTLLLAVPLVVLTYWSIVAAEEQYLLERFGVGYEAYCRAVPRWLPRLPGLSGTLKATRFRWRRLIVKEYGTPAGWIGAICFVALYNLQAEGDWAAHAQAVTILDIVLSMTALWWITAWTLKKTRILIAE